MPRPTGEIVAALRGVDFVVLFREPSVDRLLTRLKPDVHCKGPTTVDTVPGARRFARKRAHRDRRRSKIIRRARIAGAPGQVRYGVRILIVRLGSLGDLVHTLPPPAPAARESTAEIDWLVDRRTGGFLNSFRDFVAGGSRAPGRRRLARCGEDDAAARVRSGD
jgi:hypothetical protein